jgi:hypothetical protein
MLRHVINYLCLVVGILFTGWGVHSIYVAYRYDTPPALAIFLLIGPLFIFAFYKRVKNPLIGFPQK